MKFLSERFLHFFWRWEGFRVSICAAVPKYVYKVDLRGTLKDKEMFREFVKANTHRDDKEIVVRDNEGNVSKADLVNAVNEAVDSIRERFPPHEEPLRRRKKALARVFVNVYLSGHGTVRERYFFLPTEAKDDNQETWFELSQITTSLMPLCEELYARIVVVIFADTCKTTPRVLVVSPSILTDADDRWESEDDMFAETAVMGDIEAPPADHQTAGEADPERRQPDPLDPHAQIRGDEDQEIVIPRRPKFWWLRREEQEPGLDEITGFACDDGKGAREDKRFGGDWTSHLIGKRKRRCARRRRHVEPTAPAPQGGYVTQTSIIKAVFKTNEVLKARRPSQKAVGGMLLHDIGLAYGWRFKKRLPYFVLVLLMCIAALVVPLVLVFRDGGECSKIRLSEHPIVVDSDSAVKGPFDTKTVGFMNERIRTCELLSELIREGTPEAWRQAFRVSVQAVQSVQRVQYFLPYEANIDEQPVRAEVVPADEWAWADDYELVLRAKDRKNPTYGDLVRDFSWSDRLCHYQMQLDIMRAIPDTAQRRAILQTSTDVTPRGFNPVQAYNNEALLAAEFDTLRESLRHFLDYHVEGMKEKRDTEDDLHPRTARSIHCFEQPRDSTVTA